MNLTPAGARQRFHAVEYRINCIAEILQAISHVNDGEISAASLGWLGESLAEIANDFGRVLEQTFREVAP